MNLFHIISNAQGTHLSRTLCSPLCNRFLGNLRNFGLIERRGVILRTWRLVALAMLSGCAQLPLDGPAKQDIITGASAGLSNPPHVVALDYALVDINSIVLSCLSGAETDSLSRAFGGRPPALRAGVGDVLGVSVFESSAGALVSPGGPAGANTKQGNFVTIPNLTVDSSGAISVPYAGRVRVAGLTLPEIEREIESKLTNRVVEPQVVVSIVDQNAATVAVVGDTTGVTNRIKLSGSGERILDIVSKAGLKYPAYETDVTLQRKMRTATTYLPTLVTHPEENIFVQPDDVIYINRNQRKFVAVGAVGSAITTTVSSTNQTLAGSVGLFAFDQEHLSLTEAIGKAGGLLDDRADPAQVFLYRMERRKTLEKMGVDLSRFEPDQKLIPTIYRANFRDPSSFLVAQAFPMRNKDTIYVGNAEANEVSKVFAYINLWTSTPATVASNANTVVWHGP